MKTRELGSTNLKVMPLVLGGNVIGWTADEEASFRVLDAFVDHGFNAIDTADVYSVWVKGNVGGESETIIGRWLKARPGVREKVVLFTKVGSVDGGPHAGGLSQQWIMNAVERSLKRLQTEAIDLYFAHWPDESTPISETLGAFDTLLRSGKIRAIGASNVGAAQVTHTTDAARDGSLPSYGAVQVEYNLYNRDVYEGDLQNLCISQGLGVVTYYSLAAGFLTGKYRSADDLGQSQRGARVASYLNPRGMAILRALDTVSANYGATPSEIALAWLMARPGITAPIASATRVSHVETFAKAAEIVLRPEDIAVLDAI